MIVDMSLYWSSAKYKYDKNEVDSSDYKENNDGDK